MKREAGSEEILCKISEGFIKEGKREGKLEDILALMGTTKWDADKAMDMLKIECEDRPTYAPFVKMAIGSTPLAQA